MRTSPLPAVERGRTNFAGLPQSKPGDVHGFFLLPCPDSGRTLKVIASGPADQESWADAGFPGEPWEHVSVSILGEKRTTRVTPTWAEMDWVRLLFWGEEEVVAQFHVAGNSKVNFHNGVLHLWKPPYNLSLPPRSCV